jgi:hypothetical protein
VCVCEEGRVPQVAHGGASLLVLDRSKTAALGSVQPAVVLTHRARTADQNVHVW